MAAFNGGILRRLVPKTTIPFGNLQGSQTETVRLAAHIDCLGGFTQAEFLIRLHGGTNLGAAGQLTFIVNGDGYDFEDPTTSFSAALGDGTNSVVISAGQTIPYFTILSGFGAFGRYLQMQLQATQPATPGALVAEVSVDLVLKGGAALELARSPNGFRGHVIR